MLGKLDNRLWKEMLRFNETSFDAVDERLVFHIFRKSGNRGVFTLFIQYGGNNGFENLVVVLGIKSVAFFMPLDKNQLRLPIVTERHIP